MTNAILVVAVMLFVLGIVLSRVHNAHRVQMIACVIRPHQLAEVTGTLKGQKLMMGMTVIPVRGFGRQQGETDNRSADDKMIRFLPKLKLEILVRHRDVEAVIQAIVAAVRTGEIGDGKIVVYDATTAMRIRTGERGLSAL